MEYTGSMIAIMLPKKIANQIAVEDGVGRDRLHITLVYFENEIDGELLKKFLADFAKEIEPFEYKFTDYGYFEGVGDNGENAHYLGIQSQGILDLREKLIQGLEARGIEYSKAYSEYTPHVTLRYGKPIDLGYPEGALIADTITFAQGDYHENYKMQYAEKVGRRVRNDKVELLNTIIDKLQELLVWAKYDEENKGYGFKAIPDTDWFLTWTTNAFQDRENEFFTTEALERLVEEKADLEDKADVLYFHEESTKFATTKWQGLVGRFLAELHKFDDTDIGRGLKAFFAKYPAGHPEIAPYGWGCSHGFTYRVSDKEDGVYRWFDKRESTVLPLQEAANIFTLAEFFGEKNMNDKVLRDLEIISKEIEEATGMRGFLDKILKTGKQRTEYLEGQGVEFKQAVMKTEDGFEYPASCYAYVPDSEQVSTWKLRLCTPETTEVTREQLGAAAAAFSPGGFRGNRVELPDEDIEPVKAKIRAEYRKLGVEDEEIPESVKEIGGEDVMDVKSMHSRMQELVEKADPDMQEKMGMIAEAMQEKEADMLGLARQMMELAVDVGDAYLKEELVKLAEYIQETVSDMMEEEPEQEEPEEEDTEEDEAAYETEEEKEGCADPEMKELDVKEVAREVYTELKLDQLSEYLEAQKELQDKRDGELETTQKAFMEVLNQVKALGEEVQKLQQQMVSVKASDDEKKKEIAQRKMPMWSGFHASQAAETVLSNEEVKAYSKPEIPSVINNISKKITGG